MPSPASVPISACRAATAATPESPAQTHRLASHSSGLLRARRARQLPSRAAPSPPRRRLRSGALSPGATPLPGGGSPLLGASVATPLARCRVESPRGGDAGRGEREGTELPPLGGRTSRRPTCAARLKGAALGEPRAVACRARAGRGRPLGAGATWRTPYARWAGYPEPRPGTSVAAPERIRLSAPQQLPCTDSVSSTTTSSFLPSLPLSPVRRALRVPATVSQPPVLSATRLWPPTRCSTESQGPPLRRALLGSCSLDRTHCSGTSENWERGLKPCARLAAGRRKRRVSNPHCPGQPARRLQRWAQPPRLARSGPLVGSAWRWMHRGTTRAERREDPTSALQPRPQMESGL